MIKLSKQEKLFPVLPVLQIQSVSKQSPQNFSLLNKSLKKFTDCSFSYKFQKAKVIKDYQDLTKRIKLQVINLKKKTLKSPRRKKNKDRNKNKKKRSSVKLPDINSPKIQCADKDAVLRYTKNRRTSNELVPSREEESSDVSGFSDN